MDYAFENLGPERFQEFCQALLTRSFPNVQCFPLRQADGGRDAYDSGHVFQVKFSASPFERLAHKRFIRTLEEELPKLKRLALRGIQAVYVITNVEGTGRLDKGSIDRVQELLGTLGVPAYCWWRSDLSRRLDDAWDLKWAYPDLMTGTDMLRCVMEAGVTEARVRRETAMKAFVRAQYERDRKVRFRQADLVNDLLGLFVDLPLAGVVLTATYRLVTLAVTSAVRPLYSISAAQLFLLGQLPQVVLEGGPGQGKSTVAQYVCQVHRLRLLELHHELEQVPPAHLTGPLRLPIRVDLRDFAAWLFGDSPADDGADQRSGRPKSLEGFLAAQIRSDLGGEEFSISDLRAVGRVSALLLVLDGLDEVPGADQREQLIEKLMVGVTRLRETAASLQVIVTSRPAAFANSPGLPRSEFVHLDLGSVPEETVHSYADRWCKAKGLFEPDTSLLKRVLTEKLRLPHVKDLARNPMQLAILLNLIRTRGESLPDKRTALYDSYVTYYFDREAEKTNDVRDHRDLLLNLHSYLGWCLHSEAERGETAGRIGFDQLHRVLADYLSELGYPITLGKLLFNNMMERVVFLVPNQLGTFEFEVQPLREYFAARYLYETAPNSRPGFERQGTLTDRFDALARNAYWLNVTRFFAGRFRMVELPALIDRLDELLRDPDLGITSHPYTLISMLLLDRVFAQYPNCMRAAVNLLRGGLAVRKVAPLARADGNPLDLPAGCGRVEMIDACYELLAQPETQADYAASLAAALRVLQPHAARKDRWLAIALSPETAHLSRWVRVGAFLDVLGGLTEDEVSRVLDRTGPDPAVPALFLASGRPEVAEGDADRSAALLQGLLSGQLTWELTGGVSLDWPSVLAPFWYLLRFDGSVTRTGLDIYKELADTAPYENDTLQKCRRLINDFCRQGAPRSPKAWAGFIQGARADWGDSWGMYVLANQVAAAYGVTDQPGLYWLLDREQDLLSRIGIAYLYRDSWQWWEQQFAAVATNLDRMFLGLLFLTAAPITLICDHRGCLQELLAGLSAPEFSRLMRALLDFRQEDTERARVDLQKYADTGNIRTLAALAARCKSNDLARISVDREAIDDPVTWELIYVSAVYTFETDRRVAMEAIRQSYARGVAIDYARVGVGSYLTRDDCREILSHPLHYPQFLLTAADEAYRPTHVRSGRTVAEIAKVQGWFL